MLLGYDRVSRGEDQSTAAQRRLLREAGAGRVYEETVSGGRWDRPELGRLLDQLWPGDVVLVWKLDRLSRSLKCAAPGQQPLKLAQRDVVLLLDRAEEEAGLRLDPGRAAIAALGLRRRRAVRKGELAPADRAGRAHPEAQRRLPARHPARDGGDDPAPKILRQPSSHPRQPPPPHQRREDDHERLRCRSSTRPRCVVPECGVTGRA